MAREYSFEIYAPGEIGERVDYGDHFCGVRSATAAMLESMRGAPDGSTAIVYQRSQDGDILLPRRNWLKDGCAVRRVREAKS